MIKNFKKSNKINFLFIFLCIQEAMIRSFMFVFVTLLGASVALTIILLLVLKYKSWGEIVRHCENNNFIPV